MSKDCLKGIERLENRLYLSVNKWGLDAIHASDAWKNNSITNKPIVAIVDSGLDLNHINIKNKLWVNSKEIANDRIDNDKNGYIDDINGWNFASWNNKPQDNFYHGTAVAGIISSISPNASLLPIKVQDDRGNGYAGAAAAGIMYATMLKNKGENIVAINISWTLGYSDNLHVKNAIQNASNAGIVVVIAAGNNGRNLDISPQYPASYNIPNVITVSSTNTNLVIEGYSNYGRNTVDIAAPGSNINSTVPGSSYRNVSGTSFAAPQVSGSVAFLKSMNLGYSAHQIKQAILSGASKLTTLMDKVRSGFLDLLSATNEIKKIAIKPPAQSPPTQATIPTKPALPVYKISSISRNNISGWAVGPTKSPLIVEVRINNIVRYSVLANKYHIQTRANNGFYINPPSTYFLRNKTLVEIKIIDKSTNSIVKAYSGYI